MSYDPRADERRLTRRAPMPAGTVTVPLDTMLKAGFYDLMAGQIAASIEERARHAAERAKDAAQLAEVAQARDEAAAARDAAQARVKELERASAKEPEAPAE